MDILTYISNMVTNKYKDPDSRTSTFTMGGYFIYLPLSEDSNKFQKTDWNHIPHKKIK